MSKRTALITGANRGLGKETALQLAKLGMNVVLTARNVDSLGKVDIPKALRLPLDVSDPKSIERLALELEKRKVHIDVLINNAGILRGHEKNPVTASYEDLRDSLQTNTIGPFLMCQAFVPPMLENGYGRIVNVSSRMGLLRGMEDDSPAYRLSKAALNAVTRMFGHMLRDEDDVLINSVCPGWTKTEMGGVNAPRPIAQGAASIVWAATLPAGGPSGKFFFDRIEVPC